MSKSECTCARVHVCMRILYATDAIDAVTHVFGARALTPAITGELSHLFGKRRHHYWSPDNGQDKAKTGI